MDRERRIVDWNAIRNDFRAGRMTLREIGDKHGLRHPSILRRAKRDGWDITARAVARAAHKAVPAEVVVAQAIRKRIARLLATASRLQAELDDLDKNATATNPATGAATTLVTGNDSVTASATRAGASVSKPGIQPSVATGTLMNDVPRLN